MSIHTYNPQVLILPGEQPAGRQIKSDIRVRSRSRGSDGGILVHFGPTTAVCFSHHVAAILTVPSIVITAFHLIRHPNQPPHDIARHLAHRPIFPIHIPIPLGSHCARVMCS